MKPMALTVGDKLGPYEILSLIGKGGMGEVYRARDTRLDREVAIKISAERLDDRLQREARATAALNHPKICHLYDVGSNYLVMELVDGETLAARLKKGPLPNDLVLRWGSDIADALAAAHAKGIIHRDLKPGNIMITKTGVKVLDFGLAKMPIDGETVTLTNAVMGTPGYMAPEQLAGREADARTDTYALGLVLYETATGRRPSHPQLPTAQKLPPQLASVIARCLEADPEHRWQAARDVAAALELISLQPASEKPRGRIKMWIVGLAALLLLTVAASVGTLLRHAAPEVRGFRFRITPPPGTEFYRAPNRGGFALSPDGHQIAFTAIRDGQIRLWVQPFESTAARELPGTDGAHLPFWSSDSRRLGFFAAEKLIRIDADGGNLQVLADAPGPEGGAWNGQGVILFAMRGKALQRISEAGGTPAAATKLDTSRNETEHQGPQFLGGGTRFLYWITSRGSAYSGVYEGSLVESGFKVQVLKANSWAVPVQLGQNGRDYLLWVQNGTVMAQLFNSGTATLAGQAEPLGGPAGLLGNTPELTASGGLVLYGPPLEVEMAWFDRDGKRQGMLDAPVGYPEISPDQRKIAVGGPNLMVTDLARGISTRLGSSAGGFLAWSPDGSQLAYSVINRGVTNIAIRRVDGAGTERILAPSPESQSLVGWRNNNTLVLYQKEGDRGELRILSLDSREGRQVARSAKNEPQAQISADGRWLLFTSDESGRMEVYVEGFPVGSSTAERRWQISSNGGSFPRWRRDGKELFYLARDGRLMSVMVKVSGEALDFAPPRPLFALPAVYATSYSYDVSADGQRFLVQAPTVRRGREPLSGILNWPALMTRLN